MTLNIESDFRTEQHHTISNSDKKNEEKAMQKLGISKLEDLFEFFEDNEQDKFLSMFSLVKVLGSGGFGVVLQAVDIQYRKNVALKIVFKHEIKGEMLNYEYNILKDLDHPNIIKIYKLISFQKFLILSMKLTRENLADYHIRKRRDKKPLSELECAQIMKGIFSGLAYLHEEKNIIHRDLKPQNILIGSYNDLTQCKLIDFGIATQNKRKQLKKYGNIGTLIYQPPEQMNRDYNYGKGADIWAAGIIAFVLLTGKHPFVTSDDTNDEVRKKIQEFRDINFPSYISPQAKHLIERLLTREQSQRYSATEALKHPWITRDLLAEPILTKYERKSMLGAELQIENKLRTLMGTIFFMSMTQFNNHSKHKNAEPLIDRKYQNKLRAQELIQLQRTSTIHKRLMVPPSINIEKTSSLKRKEQKLQDSFHKEDRSPIQLPAHGIPQDELSPLVLEFLKKNKIKYKGYDKIQENSAYRKEPGSSQLKKKPKHKVVGRRGSQLIENNGNGNTLSVPQKMQKRMATQNNTLTDRSGSLSSPKDLKMNISGQFSDLEISIDGYDDSPAAIQVYDGSHLSGKKNERNKLPDIDSQKSLQAKNTYQEPKEILQRIKQQRGEVRDLRMGIKFSVQDPPLEKLAITPQMASNSTKKKLTMDKIENKIPQNSVALIKMMQEQIKQDEEKIKAMGKHKVQLAPGGKIRAQTQKDFYHHTDQQIASLYYNQQQMVSTAGIQNFDFNSQLKQKEASFQKKH